MSATRDMGRVVFECDFCHDTHETGEKQFPLALDAVKNENWTVENFVGQWLHFCCHACRKAFHAARQQ